MSTAPQDVSIYRDDEGRFWLQDGDGNELVELNEAQASLWSVAYRLKGSVERLAEYLEEAHQEELNSKHSGDSKHKGRDRKVCSYCRALAVAETAVKDATLWPAKSDTFTKRSS